MSRRPSFGRSLLAVGLFASGCVTTGTYNAKVSELTAEKEKLARDDSAREKAKVDELSAKIATLEAQLKDTEGRLKETSDKLAATIDARTKLQKQLDDSTALVGELKGRLEKLGQNVEKLTSEKGALAAGLDDAKVRLEELRKQKAAAEASAATFRQLIQKLRAMIDAGQLKVVIREGRMLIALPNDVLFDSGKTDIKADGKAALAKVAQVLATIPDRHFLVAGHTDDVRIHTALFPSNWELSTARAVGVTRLLIESGMKPQVLAAGGYGEFDPVVPNDSDQHRAQNRRIEIVLQPNLSDLPSLDQVAAEAAKPAK